MQTPVPARIILLFLGCVITGCASSEEATRDSTAARKPAAQSEFKPFAEIITAEAVSDTGLFTTHVLGEKHYYQIPDSLFGRDMLMIGRIAAAQADFSSYLGSGSKISEQVVRWERRAGQVLLRGVSYGSVAEDSLPIARSVQLNNYAPIIESFKILTFGSDSSAVIEVSNLFVKDVPATTGLPSWLRKQYEVRNLDPNRSFIEYVRSFPQNLEVRYTQTYVSQSPPSNQQAGTISLQLNLSMVLLPAKPMRPRIADDRVGWFSVEQVDFGLDVPKAATREFIARWRLEPKDPEAYARGELVEPVKPIVYYIDPATPMKWRPYFKQGIEDWQKAFETAGFRNAIIARDPPTPEEDPDFSPEDVRYSTVRYVASLLRNATGPSVVDPRSGEIIESDVMWYHNHLRSYRNRYIIETGGANPKARTIDVPDEEMGEMLRAVIAHEVGHALGLPHNMLSSSAYPVDSLRSPDFTQRMGLSPSIMDYARLNYIAQPGDGDVRFIRKLGPYDSYAINWGYRVIPSAPGPEAEKPTLDEWISEHENDPVYRFGRQRGGAAVDPRAQIEDLGDNPVKAGGYALANLQRVVPNLVEWTSKKGEDYSELEEIYNELLYQWRYYISHVTANIGGVYENIKTTDQPGPVYQPVPKDRQIASMRFLDEHVFQTPTWLLDKSILDRIDHTEGIDRMRRLQTRVLDHLLDPERLQRLIEDQSLRGTDAYSPLEFFGDLRGSIWKELATGASIDVYRRNLQRGYLEQMEVLMTEEVDLPSSSYFWRTPVDVSQSDIRPFVRGELETLKGEVQKALARSSDRATRYHLRDAVIRIDRILDPED